MLDMHDRSTKSIQRMVTVTTALVIAACVTFTACAGKNSSAGADATDAVTSTVGIAETTMEATSRTDTVSGQQASINAVLEEESKKIAAMMESMQAAVDKASKEAASNAAEAKSEAESKIAAEQAAAAAQRDALMMNAASLAGSMLTADSEVVSIGADMGTEAAKYQLTANRVIYEELVRLVNELRISVGAEVLTMDEDMSLDACRKALDNDYEIEQTGAVNYTADESLKTARQIFDNWKNSAAEYDNMVNPDYTSVGVGSSSSAWSMCLR